MFARRKHRRDRRSGPSPGPPEPGRCAGRPTISFPKGANVNDRTWERIERSRECGRTPPATEAGADSSERRSLRHGQAATRSGDRDEEHAAADALPERPELRRHAAEELWLSAPSWDSQPRSAAPRDGPDDGDSSGKGRDRGRRGAGGWRACTAIRARRQDLTHQARGPDRALRVRGRRGHRLLRSIERRRARRRGPRAISEVARRRDERLSARLELAFRTSRPRTAQGCRTAPTRPTRARRRSIRYERGSRPPSPG